MADSTLTLSDLDQHIVTFGIDVYPPIDISNERTRLNMFYEEATKSWPELFDQISASETEFKISKKFRRPHQTAGPELLIATFELTPRGPLMRFPLVLSQPFGPTSLESDFEARFQEIRKLFFKNVPTQKPIKIGLVRELWFSTSGQRCNPLLGASDEFAGAQLQGGMCRFYYRDQKCNIWLQFEPVQALTVTHLAMGPTVTKPGGFGVHVTLDVNSAEIHELQETDILEVIERAAGFWPRELLDYLNGRAVK